MTSCFSCLLTSAEMPLDSRCVMLLSATVRGMPECKRLESCWVKVASSCSLGLRLRCSNSRNAGGRIAVPPDFRSAGCLGAVGCRRTFHRVHGNREQPQALNLDQGRRAVGHVEHSDDNLARTPPCFV